MRARPDDRIKELDVLRGLAAGCVVLSHYSSYCARELGAGPFGVHLATVYGFYAVELFFMISGFVIYFTLERTATWKDFAFSRVSRLYPAYWTALTLMVVLESVVFGQRFWAGGYVVNSTMLQEFVGFSNLDNVFWSLTVELAFYMIMGLLFATGLLTSIQPVAAIWLALACLWSVVEQYLRIPVPAAVPRLLIFQHVPFFVGGIVFYLIARKGRTPARLALLLSALAAAVVIDGLGDVEAVAVGWADIQGRLSVAAILFGIFALAVTGRLRRLVSPMLLWLGTISYSLYLSHHNLGYSTLFWLHDIGIPISVSFLVTLVAALMLATVLTYAVERPALRVLRQWYGSREPVTSAPA
jgi:peptidoglycan/LPS O-acetylase OafA/YrhL